MRADLQGFLGICGNVPADFLKIDLAGARNLVVGDPDHIMKMNTDVRIPCSRGRVIPFLMS